MINGIKLFVAMNFMSQAMTAYPTKKATIVAPKVSNSENGADGSFSPIEIGRAHV
jgi:hypothetical protein